MRGEQSPNGLHYAREHLSCKNYMTDIDTGFKYIKFDTEKCIEEEYTPSNPQLSSSASFLRLNVLSSLN